MRLRLCLWAVFFTYTAVSACADFSAWLRRYTYPPDFRYITSEQLRSSMWRLAHHVRELDRIMRDPETLPQHRGELAEHLHAMERATDDIDRSGWPSNHPLIDMNLATLRRDIAFARRGVESIPPNYVLAGSLAGACVYCHTRR